MKAHAPSRLGRTAALAALSVMLAVASGTAGAADAGAKPAAKAKARSKNEPPPPDTLTRDELRACMARDKKRKAMREEVLKDQADLNRQASAAKAEAEAISAAAVTLDSANEEAVKAHNDRAAANNRAIDAYKENVSKVEQKANTLNAEDAAYTKDCAGRPFEERDEIAIKRGK